jgi:hypothetical protein
MHLQPGYPDYTANAAGETIVLVYGGPYKVLMSGKPSVSQVVAGYPYTPVATVNAKPLGAGVDGPGTLTITLQQDNGSTSSALLDQTDELDWTELTRAIELHPRYNGTAGQGNAFGGTRLSTAAVILSGDSSATPLTSIWDQLKEAASIATRNALVARIPDSSSKTLVLDLEVKFKAGTTNYVAPAPVARRTTRSFLKPTNVTQGKLETPSAFAGLPAGYMWLKTADRSLRQGKRGKWERVQEWTGATIWDTDLYPSA